jgi:hypothetical protein
MPMPDRAAIIASLTTGIYRTAAARELQAVRAAVAENRRGALAEAFHRLRPELQDLLAWDTPRSDRYCLLRIQHLAATGIPQDDQVFVAAAMDLMSTLTTGAHHAH